MSKKSDERLTKWQSARAEGCSPQLRAILEALGETCDVVARAQDVRDRKNADYRSANP